ncbi:hypothetical protein ACFLUV_06800, partial [Elusimicrobiota bacterium]
REKFIKDCFNKHELSDSDYDLMKKMIECARCVNVSDVVFNEKTEQIIGYIVGSADIIGQMSSRSYLEKLLLSYDKAVEINIIEDSSITEVLKRTIDFYRNKIIKRLEKDFKGLFKYSKAHFEKRYEIGYNMYIEAIDRQIEYLEDTLKEHPRSYRKRLKRL